MWPMGLFLHVKLGLKVLRNMMRKNKYIIGGVQNWYGWFQWKLINVLKNPTFVVWVGGKLSYMHVTHLLYITKAFAMSTVSPHMKTFSYSECDTGVSKCLASLTLRFIDITVLSFKNKILKKQNSTCIMASHVLVFKKKNYYLGKHWNPWSWRYSTYFLLFLGLNIDPEDKKKD